MGRGNRHHYDNGAVLLSNTIYGAAAASVYVAGMCSSALEQSTRPWVVLFATAGTMVLSYLLTSDLGTPRIIDS